MLHLLKGDKVTILSGGILRKMDDQTFQRLSSLLKMSSSVICCRFSPKDKEALTRMVNQWGRTLAVGDGANDVNMINAANIGVGVRGIEGSQATRAADYVIS
jgi:phospholipid-transporting ATPase